MSEQDSYRYTIKEVRKLLGSLLIQINEPFEPIIAMALAMIPKDVTDYIVQKCFLISLWKTVDGIAIQTNDFKEKEYVIVISDDILEKCFGGGRQILPEHWNEVEGYSTILHEFAHCWLGHKSSPSLSEPERIRQENEAFGLAEEWFKDYNLYLRTKGQPTLWEQVRGKDDRQE